MLNRCSIIIKRSFSKDVLATRWKRSDPNRYWRIQHNLPEDDEEHGPLADLPDYSYLNGEPSHLSTSQRKNYDFNASIVRRIHELDAELTQAKVMYEKKIESVMTDYNEALQIAKHMETPSSLSKNLKVQLSDRNPIPLISSSHEYSLQPNLLNALREAESFNEAFEEVVDPVGSIVPNKLMNIERPPYKRTSERRRYHRLFVRRTPKLRMFPR